MTHREYSRVVFEARWGIEGGRKILLHCGPPGLEPACQIPHSLGEVGVVIGVQVSQECVLVLQFQAGWPVGIVSKAGMANTCNKSVQPESCFTLHYESRSLKQLFLLTISAEDHAFLHFPYLGSRCSKMLRKGRRKPSPQAFCTAEFKAFNSLRGCIA